MFVDCEIQIVQCLSQIGSNTCRGGLGHLALLHDQSVDAIDVLTLMCLTEVQQLLLILGQCFENSGIQKDAFFSLETAAPTSRSLNSWGHGRQNNRFKWSAFCFFLGLLLVLEGDGVLTPTLRVPILIFNGV